MKGLLVLDMIIPFVMILVGAALRWMPVSDRRSHSGYNTPASRRTPETWDFAQRTAPEVFLRRGAWAAAASALWIALALLVSAEAMLAMALGLVLGAAFLLSAFLTVERRIREQFPD
jgi:hypothetical protein